MLFRYWLPREIAMWEITFAGVTAFMLGAAAGGPAFACHGCDRGYVDYRYYDAYSKRAGFRLGFHEYYGFYDSCYKPNSDGGFHSAVGRDCIPRAGKRRRARNK
jgi:hypothetical protein